MLDSDFVDSKARAKVRTNSVCLTTGFVYSFREHVLRVHCVINVAWDMGGTLIKRQVRLLLYSTVKRRKVTNEQGIYRV